MKAFNMGGKFSSRMVSRLGLFIAFDNILSYTGIKNWDMIFKNNKHAVITNWDTFSLDGLLRINNKIINVPLKYNINLPIAY